MSSSPTTPQPTRLNRLQIITSLLTLLPPNETTSIPREMMEEDLKIQTARVETIPIPIPGPGPGPNAEEVGFNPARFKPKRALDHGPETPLPSPSHPPCPPTPNLKPIDKSEMGMPVPWRPPGFNRIVRWNNHIPDTDVETGTGVERMPVWRPDPTLLLSSGHGQGTGDGNGNVGSYAWDDVSTLVLGEPEDENDEDEAGEDNDVDHVQTEKEEEQSPILSISIPGSRIPALKLPFLDAPDTIMKLGYVLLRNARQLANEVREIIGRELIEMSPFDDLPVIMDEVYPCKVHDADVKGSEIVVSLAVGSGAIDEELSFWEVKTAVAALSLRYERVEETGTGDFSVLVISYFGTGHGRIMQAHFEGRQLVMQYSPLMIFGMEDLTEQLFARYSAVLD